tara:strand:- start:758 stop:1033 length:276 start_codon:yes stop_codon:yes gene_type:complete
MNEAEILEVDIENLKHMLGADSRYKKSQWGFRNRFAADGSDVESMRRLEKAGLVREVKSSIFVSDYLFVATEAGCKKLGFNKKQIANALDF